MVYGTNALVVKPAISLAPMVVVNILNRYGYDQLQKNTIAKSQSEDLKHVMFTLLCCIPVVIGLLQTIFWSYFTIRENRKTDITLDIKTGIIEV